MGLFDKSYMTPSAQSEAVRSYLSGYDGIEASYDEATHSYAPVDIAQWHNCRERGYVVMFRNPARKQLNIAFFEHRNSDEICALEWVQGTLNPPTIDNVNFCDVYKDMCDVSYSVSYGQAAEMASWIIERLEAHWVAE